MHNLTLPPSGNVRNLATECCNLATECCNFTNTKNLNLGIVWVCICRSQWPRVLRRRSAAARLLRSWVGIPPGAWMFVCCERYVLSGRGLCDELITRPEESYRLWCVVVCDLEISRMRRPWPALGRSATEKKNCGLCLLMYDSLKGTVYPILCRGIVRMLVNNAVGTIRREALLTHLHLKP